MGTETAEVGYQPWSLRGNPVSTHVCSRAFRVRIITLIAMLQYVAFDLWLRKSRLNPQAHASRDQIRANVARERPGLGRLSSSMIRNVAAGFPLRNQPTGLRGVYDQETDESDVAVTVDRAQFVRSYRP